MIVVEVLCSDRSPLISPTRCEGWRDALRIVRNARASWNPLGASHPGAIILATIDRGRTARFGIPRVESGFGVPESTRCRTCERSPRQLVGGRCEVCCTIEYGLRAYARTIEGRAFALDAIRAAGFEVTVRATKRNRRARREGAGIRGVRADAVIVDEVPRRSMFGKSDTRSPTREEFLCGPDEEPS